MLNHPQTMTGETVGELIQADAAMLSIPSRLEWVGKTADYLRVRSTSSGACSPAQADKLVLALHEALTNAIVHGNLGVPSSLKEESSESFARALAVKSADPTLADRRVGVRYCFDGTRCTIAITDQGDGFDHEKWLAALEIEPDPDQPPRASGRGILMMRALVDQVEFRAGGREIELSVRAQRQASSDAAPAIGADLLPQDAGASPAAAGSSSAAVLLLEQLRRPCDDPRRQFRRVAFTTSVEIRLPGGEFQTAFSRDLSQGGIALVAPFELPPGPVELIVPMPGMDRQLLGAQVVRCQRVTAGVFDIGCRFT